MTPQHALEAHSRPDTTSGASPKNVVLSIGNAGPLGEAVLARLLASTRYLRVIAATTQSMHTTAPRLSARNYRELLESPSWPQSVEAGDVMEAVILIGGKHSFLKRDDAFPEVSIDQAITLARKARASGVMRMLVVAPMDAWSSMTLGSLAHFDELERALVPLEFSSLIIVRPSAHREKSGDRGFLATVARALLGTLAHYMTTASRQPMRAKVVAEAVVEWFARLPAGVHRKDAVSLHEWLLAKKAANK